MAHNLKVQNILELSPQGRVRRISNVWRICEKLGTSRSPNTDLYIVNEQRRLNTNILILFVRITRNGTSYIHILQIRLSDVS